MNFSNLPDPALFQIFEYLPLEDCFRAGHVNKSFRRISQLAISRTKCLDLTECRFDKMTSDQLGVILDLCSSNLEKIKFPDDDDTEKAFQMAMIFIKYRCPRLTSIDFNHVPNFIVFLQTFDQLILNAPNLENLIWDADFTTFPNINCNNLKKLTLRQVFDSGLQMLTGRFPNLTDLDLITNNISANVFDEFLISVPQIRSVKLHLIGSMIDHEDLVNLWTLPLTSLTIMGTNGIIGGEGVLYKVATSFPRIRRIWMFVESMTNEDIAALASLEDLEILELDLNYDIDDVDGFGQLIACKRLRKFSVMLSVISPGTLIALFRNCPQLEHVVISEIAQVESPEEAIVILESLSGMRKRDITIEFHAMTDDMEESLRWIWDSEFVKDAIGRLERDEGFKVKIDWTERQIRMVMAMDEYEDMDELVDAEDDDYDIGDMEEGGDEEELEIYQ